MMNRRLTSGLVLGAVALLVVTTIVVANRLAGIAAGQSGNTSPQPVTYQGVDLGGTPAPGFSLTDQSGATVTLDQFHGRPVVLTFFDSVCPHADCSLMAEYLNATAKDLGAKQTTEVAWVALSVDPWHDTPTTVAAFLTSRQVTLPIHYLLGTPQQLTPLWNAYHMQAILQSDGVVVHTTGVYLIDAQGRERTYLDEGFDPAIASKQIHNLLAGTSTPSGTVGSGQPSGTFAQAQTVNGDRIALTAAAGQFGTYTFTVTAQDNQGVPMQGATVTLNLTMPAMAMTPLHVTAPPLNPPVPGSYQAPGVLSMRGEWQVVVRVQPSGGAQPVQVTFRFTAAY
jgi:protein SCO1